jgi:hypothetical protein
VLLTAAAHRAADPAPGSDEWKYDVVYRKKAEPFKGLVIEQTKEYVVIRDVTRKPGAPTLVFTVQVNANQIERVELLEPKERELLSKRLDAIKEERELLASRLKALEPGGKGELTSGEALDLQKTDWVIEGKPKALAYESGRFRLVSNASEQVVQLAAIQLEDVYAAYARTLPPRVTAEKPTTIILTQSMADYQTLLRGQGHNLLNPAYYDSAKNQIVCASDLQRLYDELERTRQHHEKLRAELKDREADLLKVYKGKIPAELAGPIEDARQKIKATEERNEEGFKQARRRLFQRLYHEAFHAYLATYVYPASECEVPRWLNEGLAQIFESAIVEAGELRMGHADKEHYAALRTALTKGTLLSPADLLRSGPKQFLVAHAAEQQAADRYYLASWALAHYLTFERKVLGTKAMDEYVKALKRGADPLEAFSDLVGQPLAAFEKEHLHYLKHLRQDGSVGK